MADLPAKLDNLNLLPQSPVDVDGLISRELLELSIVDRNAIDEEIHGVGTVGRRENPELLRTALVELSKEIDNILDQNPLKASYLKSQYFEDTYVNTEDFRLRFIRCDLFDTKKAAIRLMKFLNVASDLMGSEVLRRLMRTSDFSREEMKLMRTGPFQALPNRDRSGRPVIAWVDDFAAKLGTLKVRGKIILFMMYCLSDDTETQQKGLVHVTWPGNKKISSIPDPSDLETIKKVIDGIPIRICAAHFCLPDRPYFHLIRAMFAVSMAANHKGRLKFHIGETIELQYALQSYGIPFELIPVTGTGNTKTAYHRQWIRLRKTLDIERQKENGEDASKIELPRSTDIIFRTGNSLTCHPGNSMLQNVIESKMQRHSNASQFGKKAITTEIIEDIKRKNGRFLQWDKRGWWTEIQGKSNIHSRVAVSVRDFKSKLVAKKNRQNFESGTSVFKNQDGKRRKIARLCGNDSDSSYNQDCSLLSIN